MNIIVSSCIKCLYFFKINFTLRSTSLSIANFAKKHFFKNTKLMQYPSLLCDPALKSDVYAKGKGYNKEDL